jgi:hypothetical protein
VLFQHQQIDSPPFWQINMTYLPTVVASAFLWIQLRSRCGVLPALAGASFYLIGPLAFDVTAAVGWSFLGVAVFIVLLSLVPQVGSPSSLKWIVPVAVLPLFVILPFISHRYGPGWEMHLLPHYVLLGLSNVFVGFGVIAILSRKLGDGRLVPYVALGILGLLAGPVVNEFGAAARALVLPFAALLYAVGTRFIIDIPWIQRRPFALNITLLLAAGAILHLLKIGLDGHPFEVW